MLHMMNGRNLYALNAQNTLILKWAKLLKNHHIETSCKYALLHFCLYQQNSEIKTDKICWKKKWIETSGNTELHIVA